jgi:hypothetical protein
MKLDDQLLERFINKFYGSGNYEGKYWFIGIEEGGGNTLEEVSNRLNVWKGLGEKELVDVTHFHIRLDDPTRFFSDPVKLQQTWRQLIRMILIAEGEDSNNTELKAYQRDRLGRKDQDTCLLEILPLCSPNTSTWHYVEWSNLHFLKDRKTYENYCRERQCSHLRTLIKTCQPEVVVFYSNSSKFQKWWHDVAGPDVNFHSKDHEILHGFSEKTLFMIINHPARRGISNDYFVKAGSIIKSYRHS